MKYTWKEVAISHAEFDFNVDSVGIFAFDERGPQPVIYIIVGHITHDIRAPIYALFKVGETFFYPLE